MKCPHCLTAFHDDWFEHPISWPLGQWLAERDGNWHVRATRCAACNHAVVDLRLEAKSGPDRFVRVWPKGAARAPLSTEVPEKYAADYREACLVLADSPKASAALSRRCLQLLLRDEARVKPGDLSKEIDEVLAQKTLPASIAEAVDAIRHIGNFAAHPNKGTNSGEIIDVEPGEAEWSLDVLESLFDFYFVGPAVLAAKKAALNKKLADAGKQPMK